MVKYRILTFLLFIGCVITCQAQSTHPPISISFSLKDAGYVTLVIEDKTGRRVRNLISETWFEAGKNITWWDGLDDLGRDLEAAHHGLYNVPGKLVAPGTYVIRGLVHPEIKTTYEFPIYTAGKTPWNTKDHTGGWLANHTAPQAAVFVPAAKSPTGQAVVFLGSYVSEGPDGIMWVDLNGNKKGGKKWVGGAWTAAPFMARDAGNNSISSVSVYVASVWETGNGGEFELRITAMPKSDKPILKYNIGSIASKDDKLTQLGGIAVNNSIGIVSLKKKNQLLFIDFRTNKIINKSTVDSPTGVAFDKNGRLLLLSGKKLLRFNKVEDILNLKSGKLIISSGLLDPVAVTTDPVGNIYISDNGASNQVKVFTADGKFSHTIGESGLSKAGPYNPLHMNNPAGLTIDDKNHLWVTENDLLPKRISMWELNGKFIKAFYGPAKYGGGGTLDSQNQNNYYYAEGDNGSMMFNIDWETGEFKLDRVFYRKVEGSLKLPLRNSAPETPIYYKGTKYFTNSFNSNPTGGSNTAMLFIERNGIAYPAVAMGNSASWDILKRSQNDKTFFIWSDNNGDAKVQIEEVTFQNATSGGITVMPDLSFCVSNLNGTAVQFSPVRFTEKGVPKYQLNQGKVLATGVLKPGSTGGNQVLAAPDGWTVITQGVKPFEQYSITGTKDGKPMWSYPNLWPGLHASHEAPIPSSPGELIGPTRLLGNFLEMEGKESGRLWAINSNHGMIYIFTSDGLFVTRLFEPMRAGKIWDMPSATRGMNLKGQTLQDENFWPSLSQVSNGNIYLSDGARSSLIRIDGLQRISRLPLSSIVVSENDLQKINLYHSQAEIERQKNNKTDLLKVPLLSNPIVIDGKLDEWNDLNWVDIDNRGTKANFNSNSKPYNVKGAVAVAGNKLYLGFKTGNPDLLRNSGEASLAPFKTGGALDIMIGTNSSANPDRKTPVAGDLRLIITYVKNRPLALVYRAVLPGFSGSKVPFSSPWRTITFDQVEDISNQLIFKAGKDGEYEASIPLSILGLKPTPGMLIKGDIGILRGDGVQTLSRTYWNNKATAILSDVPSEAELLPKLWGTWQFIIK